MGPHDIAHALTRWIHVVAGILWIGHLYFFNWVNAQLVKTYDADTKKKVVPELMPRALYMFRWGAAFTWITGILLLVFVFYSGRFALMAFDEGQRVTAFAIGAVAIFGGPVIYDQLWKALKAEQHTIGIWVSFALILAIAAAMHFVGGFTERALYIHIGSMFGTTMAFNVWMRIWPAQKHIIGCTKEGKAPEAAQAALAGLRSKHNTYMSVPLVAMMLNQHMTFIYGLSAGVNIAVLGAVILAGWGFTYWMYEKSGKPEVTALD